MPVFKSGRGLAPAWCELEFFDIVRLVPGQSHSFARVGKKEKLLPYNSFKAVDLKECPIEKMLTRNFPNPDCMRYELHRVWVVEATLKPQYRHIYKKRRFFWDEDGFVAGTTENYDAAGKLYRMIAPLQYPYPEGGAHFSSYIGYDVQTGGAVEESAESQGPIMAVAPYSRALHWPSMRLRTCDSPLASCSSSRT